MSGIVSTVTPAILLPPKVIVNAYSSGAPAGISLSGLEGFEILSGILTLNTLKALLTISTPGVLTAVSCYTKDATNRTVRLQIVLDGTTAFDATSAAIAAGSTGIVGVGLPVSKDAGNAFYVAPQEAAFGTKCVISVASSISETDKIAIKVAYRSC